MKSKPLSQLVPDFKAALEEGLEVAAGEITEQLKVEGPYWTGFFESLWVVEPGKTKIVANVKDATTSKKKRPGRDYTDVFVPESPNLGGYTIGNKANYRLYAMDILPSPTGRQGGDAPNKTADKKWFDTYVNAKMPETINRSLWRSLRGIT